MGGDEFADPRSNMLLAEAMVMLRAYFNQRINISLHAGFISKQRGTQLIY
jgi:hypothetical protein